MVSKKVTIEKADNKFAMDKIEFWELNYRLGRLENFIILAKQECRVRRLEAEMRELKNQLAV